MLDIGWSELAVIGVVALVVIGPKELPKTLKQVGGWVRNARQLAWEFQQQWEQMARDTELAEVKKTIDDVRNFNLNQEVEKAIDPDGSLRSTLADATKPIDFDEQASSAAADMVTASTSARDLPDLAPAWAPPPPPPRDLPVPAGAWAPPSS